MRVSKLVPIPPTETARWDSDKPVVELYRRAYGVSIESLNNILAQRVFAGLYVAQEWPIGLGGLVGDRRVAPD